MDSKYRLMDMLCQQREKLVDSLRLNLAVEDRMPEDERWQAEKPSCLLNTLGGTLKRERRLPSEMLDIGIQTVDEYLRALEGFSDREFAAFMLGLGLSGMRIPYWGLKQLNRYLQMLSAAQARWGDTTLCPLSATPSEHFDMMPALTADNDVTVAQVIAGAKALTETMIETLS